MHGHRLYALLKSGLHNSTVRESCKQKFLHPWRRPNLFSSNSSSSVSQHPCLLWPLYRSICNVGAGDSAGNSELEPVSAAFSDGVEQAAQECAEGTSHHVSLDIQNYEGKLDALGLPNISHVAHTPGSPEHHMNCGEFECTLKAIQNRLILTGLSEVEAAFVASNAPMFVRHLKSEMESNSWDKEFNVLIPFLESVGLNFDQIPIIVPLVKTELAGSNGLFATVALLDTFAIDKKLFGQLIERNHWLLECSASDVSAKINYLLDLGVMEEDVGEVIKRCPEILCNDLELKLTPFVKMLDDFQAKGALQRLLKHYPKRLSELSKVDYHGNLSFLFSFGLQKAEVSKLIKRHPEILFMDIVDSMVSKIEFLKSYEVKARSDICRIITRCPAIFNYSIDSIKLKLDFLESIGVKKEKMGGIMLSFPSILAHSIENKMKPVIDLLKNIGITSKVLSKLITLRPAIFAVDAKDTLPKLLDSLKDLDSKTAMMVLAWGLSHGLDQTKERLEYLQGLGFDSSELTKMISEDPRILHISRSKLEEKVNFLTNEMGYSKNDLVNNSTFLYSNIETRIKPRYNVLAYLHSRGLIQKVPKLGQITKRSNAKFKKKYVQQDPVCLALFKRPGEMTSKKIKRPPLQQHK